MAPKTAVELSSALEDNEILKRIEEGLVNLVAAQDVWLPLAVSLLDVNIGSGIHQVSIVKLQEEQVLMIHLGRYLVTLVYTQKTGAIYRVSEYEAREIASNDFTVVEMAAELVGLRDPL